MNSQGNFIGGKWRPGLGHAFQSQDPFNGDVIWAGMETASHEVDDAVAAARQAFGSWSGVSGSARREHLQAFNKQLELHREELTLTISREVGKPLWESAGEVSAMLGKLDNSLAAFAERCSASERPARDVVSVTRFRPHGVVAVFGPFNFPGHLPNGHILPALLAGNTVVFKPSELTPSVGELMTRFWHAAGLPAGVLNLVQGARETGMALAAHPGIDGLFFTGSSATGKAIHQQYGGRPEKILALEMGGNNPLVVHDYDNLAAAVNGVVQSAYLTAGQRCVCARRLITTSQRIYDELTEAVSSKLPELMCGYFRDEPEPFMGPVISPRAAERVLAEQQALVARGAVPLVTSQLNSRSPSLLTPGLLDVTGVANRPDEEIFGPVLQVVRADGLQAAIAEANNTAYGLAAAIFCRDRGGYETFFRQIRAGIVNWNRPTTGASSAAPFGGIGQSGNHRPSAYLAADYCAYPVASMESETLQVP